jgi:hypothetical protein
MKFTIRDLFLVTVILALAVGWWVERQRVTRLEREKNRESWRVETLADVMRHERAHVDIVEDEIVIDRRDWKTVTRPLGNRTFHYYPSLPNSSAPAPNPPKP